MKKTLIDDFYYMALVDLAEGASIGDLKAALKYYESLEDFEACAGILKALNEVRSDTITAIKNKLNEIRKDKKSG
jgi:hypothetical protein